MANSMNLPIPVVGVDTGPNWANAINNCLNLIAEHTHASGSGVQVTPTGLNINAPLIFNGNPLQSAAYLNILPQAITVPTPINGSLYVSGVDLFFRDGAGNNITITQGGNVLAGSTGIISGTATASFVGSVFTVLQAPGVRAHVDASSYVFKYNGSYQTPPTQSVVIQAPSAMAGQYALTLPPGLPGINNAIMVSNTVGQLSFITSDTVANDMTSTGANIIAGKITTPGANAIASQMDSTGADSIATEVTSVGANAVGQAMTAVGANAIAVSMNSVGANSIGSKMTTAAASLTSGGQFVVVSQTNAASPFGVLAGTVNANGSINNGVGFTTSSGTPGLYVITFNSPFAGVPIATVSPFSNTFLPPTFIITAQITTIGTNFVEIAVINAATAALFQAPFMFHVIGRR